MKRIDSARHTGHRGGLIEPHRSMLVLPTRRGQALNSVLLVLAFVVAWGLVANATTSVWGSLSGFCCEVLGLPVTITTATHDLPLGMHLSVPRLETAAGAPDRGLWWIGMIFTVAVAAISFALPRRWLPLLYFLRLTALVQAGAQLNFAVFPGAFPYDTAGYTEVLFLAMVALIGLVPVIFGMAFFPLDFDRRQQIAIVALTMLYLAVLVPLQFTAHVALIHFGSLLWMPMLFWMAGLSLDVGIVIALYAWAVSWEPRPWQPPRAAKSAAAVALALLGLLHAPAQAQDRTWSLQLGVDRGEYTEDLGSFEGEFAALGVERPWKDRWRIEVGRAARFGDEGVGYGFSYARHLSRRTVVSTGLSSGTGDVIFPDLRFDLGLRRTDLLGGRMLADLGYTHIESKGENSSDGFGGGVLLAVGGPWSVGLDGRVDIGQPGDTRGHTVGASLLYGIYRRFYANLRGEIGRVAYTLVGPGDALVEYNSRGLRGGLTFYLRPDRGVAVEGALLDSEVYDLWTVGLRAFREW